MRANRSMSQIRLRRGLRGPCRRRPVVGIVEEGFDGGELGRGEIAQALGHGEDIPPRGERVQRDLLGGEAVDALREDAVMEDDESMADLTPGGTNGVDEIELRGALAGEVLDQQ